MITVSAVVPTYNRASTLGRALASIFEQTRLPDEVIVVDDGSTDATADVVRGYPRARLITLGRNRGAANARNEGTRHARGEFIAFLDSDDAWLPNKLEVQCAAMAGAARPDLICTGITVRNSGGGTEHHGFNGVSPDRGWSFDEFQNYPFCPSTWLIRRSVFEASGPFDATMKNCEDLEFLARIAGRHRMQVIADPLVVKHNLHDSLDSDPGRTAASYEVLFARYPALWARAPQSVVRSLVRLASMHMSAGDAGKARASLWRALRRRPRDPQPWALLLASLFGPRTYLRAWRRVATP